MFSPLDIEKYTYEQMEALTNEQIELILKYCGDESGRTAIKTRRLWRERHSDPLEVMILVADYSEWLSTRILVQDVRLYRKIQKHITQIIKEKVRE